MKEFRKCGRALWRRGLTGMFFLLTACTARAETVMLDSGGSGVIPKPLADVSCEGFFVLNPKTQIVYDTPQGAALAVYLNEYLGALLGSALTTADTPRGGNNIILRTGQSASIAKEGYRLQVSGDGITIDASDRGGLFNGIQTLLQLMPAQVYLKEVAPGSRSVRMPCREITDAPRFEYRGMMLDVARTFFPKDQVIAYIEWLSHHKINKFHWHLTDDEGWRIEIKSLPGLAEQGGFRGGDSPILAIYGAWDRKYGGYYTQEEIREVVAFAAFRNIEIIPEIDLPGHSRAAARIYPEILCPGPRNMAAGYDNRNVWCVSREENYRMLESILGEIAGLFPAFHIHIGGDEVMPGQWAACPKCSTLGSAAAIADHFSERTVKILASHGKQPAVWNEAVKGGKLSKESLVYGWENVAACHDATDKGYHTVVMPGSFFYYDMRQSPAETGQVWAGAVSLAKSYGFRFDEQGFGPARLQKVAGVEASFFSELALSNPAWYLEYVSYPRICALAETGWCREQDRSWDDFYMRLRRDHLARLSAMGIRFRLDPPDAAYKNDTIIATPSLEGMDIFYTRQPATSPQTYAGALIDRSPERYLFKGTSADAPTGISPEVKPAVCLRGSLAAGEARTLDFDLSATLGRTDHKLWYLTLSASREEISVSRIEVKTATGATVLAAYTQKVNSLNAFRLTTTNGILHITLKNAAKYPADIRAELVPSPYMEPKVTLTSTVAENSRFPFSRATDYQPTSYSRTSHPPKKGDTFTYTFAAPLVCHSIELATGLYYMPRYLLPEGYVEVRYDYDGAGWERAGDLAEGRAILYPQKPVRAVRIVSTTDGNGENALALQDLRILPIFPN